MKKFRKGCCGFLLALCFLAGFGVFSNLCTVNAEAASSGYKAIQPMNGKIMKIGKYYFKSDSRGILISKKKKGTYQVTPIYYGAYGNGSQAFYVKEYVLYKYTYSSGKETKVKKLPASGAAQDPALSYYVSDIYGNQIYLTKGSQGQWKHWTYSYNIKTKKLKKVLSNCAISARSGKYVVGQNEYRTDVSAYPMTLYKIKSSGLKKVKKLASYGWEPTFTGGKLYYVSSTDSSMHKVALYRCNPNGTGKKKIKTFSASERYGQVLVVNITSKSCDVSMDGKVYRYTYATKKMKEVKIK